MIKTTRLKTVKLRFVIQVLLTIIVVQYAYSQENASLESNEFSEDKNKKSREKEGKEFNVAPYINYSSTQGVGFGLVPMYSFPTNPKDSISPKSIAGMVGYYTTEKSNALLTFGALFFDEDNWRVQYGVGVSDYNFQTYYEPPLESGQGIFLDYGTKAFFANVNVRRSIGKRYYAGLGYLYQGLDTQFDYDSIPNISTKLSMLQIDLFRDTRTNVNYPKSGTKALTRLQYMPTWIGNDVNSNVLLVNYNRYFGVNHDRDVIAARFHTKAGLSNVRFQQQPVLGGVDLRGYSSGKYRGDGVLDIQSEYRWNFPNKLDFSAVGFAGVGTIYGSSTESFNWKLYPSIGGGIRYTAIKSAHINIGLDAGVGKDDWGVYFRFNEAF